MRAMSWKHWRPTALTVWVIAALSTLVGTSAVAASHTPAEPPTSSVAKPKTDPPGPCYPEEETQQRRGPNGERYTCKPGGEAGYGWKDNEGRS